METSTQPKEAIDSTDSCARATVCQLKSSDVFRVVTRQMSGLCLLARRVDFTKDITTSCRASALPIRLLTTTRRRSVVALVCTTIASRKSNLSVAQQSALRDQCSVSKCKPEQH